MHRCVLESPDAVTFTLVLVIAYQCADCGQGIVFKQHPARVIQPAFLQEPDYFGNVGMNRAARLAAGLFTLEAAVCLLHHMQCHILLPFMPIVRAENNARI